GDRGLTILEERPVSIVLLDLSLPDMGGEDLLPRIQQNHPDIPVLVVTALGDLEAAVRCMTQGAYDYIVKGGDPSRLVSSARRALESRRKGKEIEALRERMQAVTLKRPQAFANIVTGSERMRVLFRFIEAVADTGEPILIQGETGTGKELFAEAVHRASGTRGPFVATNLGGLDDFVVSDTLFGHTKGAFTGADEVRKGMVASAAEGTLFLDEIGDLSPPSQVKLLRFLENREYYPLGSDLARRSNARIVAATNRDLDTLADEGRFRKDLLYRLSTYRIDIPPLRERPEDIPLLCSHFLKTLAQGHESPALTSGAQAALLSYSYPGNVRELRGLLLRAKVLAEGATIGRAVVEQLVKLPSSAPDLQAPAEFSLLTQDLPTIRQAIEALVKEALSRTGGHQAEAAHLLGISPQALSKRLKRTPGPHP
ncbi:MAG TPA: sigma-54 dependent transcriptional regulator, partial [Spirochaetia bacterium]|nr:sigma-54 dependent transcriptional regulator [Spirochaetia bacterium]